MVPNGYLGIAVLLNTGEANVKLLFKGGNLYFEKRWHLDHMLCLVGAGVQAESHSIKVLLMVFRLDGDGTSANPGGQIVHDLQYI